MSGGTADKAMAPARKGEKRAPGQIAPKQAGAGGNEALNGLRQMLQEQMTKQGEILNNLTAKASAKSRGGKAAKSKESDPGAGSFGGRARGDKIVAAKWGKLAAPPSGAVWRLCNVAVSQ